MSIPFYNDIDLKGNTLKNYKVENLTEAPTNPVKGQQYFNVNDNKLYYYDGSSWTTGISNKVTIPSTIPTNPVKGDCYIDDKNCLRLYTGYSWNIVDKNDIVTTEDYQGSASYDCFSAQFNYTIENNKVYYIKLHRNPVGSTFQLAMNSTGAMTVLNNSGEVISSEKCNSGSILAVTRIATYTVQVLNIFKANEIEILDNLTSTKSTSALSANQGKILKDLIDDINNRSFEDFTNQAQESTTSPKGLWEYSNGLYICKSSLFSTYLNYVDKNSSKTITNIIAPFIFMKKSDANGSAVVILSTSLLYTASYNLVGGLNWECNLDLHDLYTDYLSKISILEDKLDQVAIDIFYIAQMGDGTDCSEYLDATTFSKIYNGCENIILYRSSGTGGNGYWKFKINSISTYTNSSYANLEVINLSYINNYISPAEINTISFSLDTGNNTVYKGQNGPNT